MEIQKVFESDGTWWTNTCQFPMVDPTSGCRFEPNVPTQAKQTEWMKGQVVIQPYKAVKAAEPDKTVKTKTT